MTQSAEQRDVTQVSPSWLNLLAGPLVWALYFLVVYTLGEFGCRGGWLQGRLLGLPAPAVAVSALTVAALVIGALTTYRTYRQWATKHGEQDSPWFETEERNRFMLLAGWMLGALFTYLILLTGIPALVLPQCA
jgi:hypothetical protein